MLTTPKTVLFYVPSLVIGGTETQLVHLASGLAKARFNASVMSSGAWGPLGDRLAREGVPVYLCESGQGGMPSSAECVRLIRRLRPAIFHSFSYLQSAWDVQTACEAGIRIIITSRRNMRHWDVTRSLQPWERVRNQRTSCVVANCEAVAALCAEVEGVPRRDLRTIRNGVVATPRCQRLRDAARFSVGADPSDIVIGTVGNLRAEKGHDVLIRAFKLIHDRTPNSRLVVCGAARYNITVAGMEEYVEALRLGGRVSFLGYRPATAFLPSVDLYIHSSRAEGLPNAVLEAMAQGVPVIATDVGGTAELIEHGVSGVLVPAGNAELLAEAALKVLKDSRWRAALAKKGHERAASCFSIQDMVRSYEKTYEELLVADATSEERALTACANNDDSRAIVFTDGRRTHQ